MTTPAVLYPDAALVTVDYLRPLLAARGLVQQVGTRVPNPRGDFVRVQRTGGPRLNLVADQAQLTIECWAATEKAAHDLAQTVRALVHAMRGRSLSGVPVYRVDEFTGPALLPDPESDQPRYSQTFTVAMRGVELPAL